MADIVLRDVRYLSEEMLRKLTGIHQGFRALDETHRRFERYVLANPKAFDTWQQAWRQFATIKPESGGPLAVAGR